MPKKVIFLAVLVLLIAGGVVASLGERNPDVGLSSVREIWADVLRDADQVGLKATRVTAAEEMQIGAEMSATMPWPGHADAERYVTAVAARLTPNVRRKEIRYTFHVIGSPEVNAFALPGGHIYVLQGLLDFLKNESELAAILGHEISHVDLRHCIERYQYELALKKVGARDLGVLAEVAHSLVAIGYTQYQELEADAQGERLAIEAGYDPEAALQVFHRMQEQFGGTSIKQPETPVGEVTRSIGEAIGSYFQTHPPSGARERQLDDLLARNRRQLGNREFYVGIRNYREQVARNEREYPEEKKTR
ncbi:MAG TPA: M48 family metallopeptidase [Bryobacteraceae bacterium]|nr:M48 family metallopeptidase [Bryobacteraceae bacterium]